MANKNLVVSTRIVVNGKQAEMTVQALKNEVDRLTDSLEQMQAKLLDPSQWGENETEETIKTEIKRLQRDVKTAERLYRSAKSSIKGIDEVLGNISHASYNELTRTRGLLQSSIKSLDPVTEKYKQKVTELQLLNEEITRRSQDVKGSMDFDTAKYILQNAQFQSVDKIQEAITAMTRFRDTMTENKETYREWNGYVLEGEKYLQNFKRSAKLTVEGIENLDDIIAHINDIDAFKGSIEDLETLKKWLEEIKTKELTIGDEDTPKKVKKIDEALFKYVVGTVGKSLIVAILLVLALYVELVCIVATLLETILVLPILTSVTG